LIIWGSGLKKGAIQISFILLMFVFYGGTQLIWPEAGKNIFLGLLIVAGVIGFFFKDKIMHLFGTTKKKKG
jgi:hypothetical protein